MKYRVLYNPLAGNGHGEENARLLSFMYNDNQLVYYDMTRIKSYPEFFGGIYPDDAVIICGGDGTLNRFVNDTEGLHIGNDIMYFATGRGNDFLRDLEADTDNGPVKINKFLESLPVVTVNGMTMRFLNNVGFGMDGYCCEVSDKLREKSNKPVNYALIAGRGLSGNYKPANAVVTVDGEKSTYRNVWLASPMNGRYYSGMMAAPEQDRLNNERLVSIIVLHGTGKLKTLIAFPTLFKGTHVKYKDMVSIFTGRDITVEFDRPCALQIDGETVHGVRSYHVTSPGMVIAGEHCLNELIG